MSSAVVNAALFDKIQPTLKRLFQHRGYEFEQRLSLEPSINPLCGGGRVIFNETQPQMRPLMFVCQCPPMKTIHVVDVHNIVQNIVDNHLLCSTQPVSIIIVIHDLSKRQKLDGYCSPENVFVQLFSHQQLSFCILDHELVPDHTIVTEEVFEQSMLLQKLTLRKEHLPIILSSDPVARFIGLQPKQLCKITRYSKSNGKTISFKICA